MQNGRDMPHVAGLFVTGTDTDVGKTYVASLIVRCLVEAGHRVGVYKPVASGCRREGDRVISGDALSLWEAAGRPGELDRVCPQRFVAPLAPHLAAEAEGTSLDEDLFVTGLDYWRDRSDVLVVEGVGGLMCPLNHTRYVAELAAELGFPLLVVARNRLGTINLTLQTLIAATTFHRPLDVAGLILNESAPTGGDPSVTTNRQELVARCSAPLLAGVGWGSRGFDAPVDWRRLAR